MKAILQVVAAVVLALATADILASHASEPSDPPHNADTIAIAEISGGTYAVVTRDPWVDIDAGVQIINITDPAAPAHITSIADDTDGFTHLKGAAGVTISEISGGTYAMVASLYDNGVQIINVTDPAAPSPVAVLANGADGFAGLGWPVAIAVSEISGGTYGVVTNHLSNSVQVVNITDPASPTPVTRLADDSHPFCFPYVSECTAPGQANGITRAEDGFTRLAGAVGVETAEISGSTYAVVAGAYDRGVQIINITDPAAPAPVIGITDDARWAPTGYTELHGAWSVAIPEIANGTYAVVASKYDSGVQIINITDPASPSPIAGITDSAHWAATGYDVLNGAFDVAVSEISNRTYAVVASEGDGGLQIIDITDPASPSPAAGITGETDGFAGLSVRGVKIAEISGRTYAVVASWDGGLQMIDITDPASSVYLGVTAD